MVVTIVVLLILAGVSISLILDNNGIIQKGKDARREYGQAKENEQKRLFDLSDMIDDVTSEQTLKVNVNTKATGNGTINGEKGNFNNPTIPKGYIPIDEGQAIWGDGSSAPSQNSIDHGLVIKDDKNNEWVWIPVDSTTLTTMYEISTKEDGENLCGNTGVTTNKYSKSRIISKKPRTTPGTTTAPYYREPDLVVGMDGEGYDIEDIYYKTILGETGTKEQLAQLFVNEYNKMIYSIEKYEGFYIGRYELSKEGVQKDKEVLIKTNWYDLYKKCKELNASNKVETRMIWGCQWDVTCNFIANKGDKKSITDSSSWGNYKNTSVKSDDGTTELKKSGTHSVLNTGITKFTMANNIYDFAGNCWEWTQEASKPGYRAVMGGGCVYYGSVEPASSSASEFCNPCSNTVTTVRHSSNINNKVG